MCGGQVEDNLSPLDQETAALPLLPTTHRKAKSRHGAIQTKPVSGSWEGSFPERML